jgi:mycofactocin precursor
MKMKLATYTAAMVPLTPVGTAGALVVRLMAEGLGSARCRNKLVIGGNGAGTEPAYAEAVGDNPRPRSLSAGTVGTSEVTAHAGAVCTVNAVVHLAMDPIMKADMQEQAVFEATQAQPGLTEDEPARELLVEEVWIDGMHGGY